MKSAPVGNAGSVMAAVSRLRARLHIGDDTHSGAENPARPGSGDAADPPWVEAADALRAAGAPPAAVLAPEGFAFYCAGVREYRADANLARLGGGEIGWLVVHKDHLARLDAPGLAGVLVDARLVFANEVFGVFSLATAERRAEPHVASFIALLRDRSSLAPGSFAAFMQSQPSYRLQTSDLARSDWRALLEQFCEDKCRSIVTADDRILCRVLGKYLMWVDAHDHGLSPHLLMQGYWEMWITQALARLTTPGTTVIDVGANVGYCTLLLADAVGPSGRVISFEPNPRIAAMLRMSVSINGLASRVSVRNEAVSSVDAGRLQFAIPTHEPKNAALVRDDAHRQAFAQIFGAALEFIDVPLLSLDSLGLENVGVVKIDAEGAEGEIWHGMQQTIRNNHGIRIVMEFNAARLEKCHGAVRCHRRGLPGSPHRFRWPDHEPDARDGANRARRRRLDAVPFQRRIGAPGPAPARRVSPPQVDRTRRGSGRKLSGAKQRTARPAAHEISITCPLRDQTTRKKYPCGCRFLPPPGWTERAISATCSPRWQRHAERASTSGRVRL